MNEALHCPSDLRTDIALHELLVFTWEYIIFFIIRARCCRIVALTERIILSKNCNVVIGSANDTYRANATRYDRDHHGFA